MKQTAVEFYHSELKKILYNVIVTHEQVMEMAVALEQAKEMENQQIIDTYIECKRQYVIQESCYPPQFVVQEAEHYYNEKFKNK